MTEGQGRISNYALDRIMSITNVSIKYKETDVDFDEWFDDVIGVTVTNREVEKILIKVRKERYGYIRTKPFHHTQIERKDLDTENFTFITIEVKENNELITVLASFGEDIEVVSPASIRNKIKSFVKKMYRLYYHE